MKLSNIHNKLINREYNKMIEYIHEYGNTFWNDYFLFLLKLYPTDKSASIYSDTIKFYFNI